MTEHKTPIRSHMISMRSLIRLCGCGAVLVIVWLSLIPGDMQTRTFLPKQAEHFIAYLLTAFCIAISMTMRKSWLYLAIGLTALALLLEISQTLAPGRTPGFGDFLASALGAWAGSYLAMLMSGAPRK